jgi:hypothetical protein
MIDPLEIGDSSDGRHVRGIAIVRHLCALGIYCVNGYCTTWMDRFLLKAVASRSREDQQLWF